MLLFLFGTLSSWLYPPIYPISACSCLSVSKHPPNLGISLPPQFTDPIAKSLSPTVSLAPVYVLLPSPIQ